MIIIVKIGSSSLTQDNGEIERNTIDVLAAQIAKLKATGAKVILVTSGAISAGLTQLGHLANTRPTDPDKLRAASALGQVRLMAAYVESFAEHDLNVAQVLLAPEDLWARNRYLNGRGTFTALLDSGAVPIVNENDAVVDDEIRFGDNDRLAALVAHLVGADLLLLLTDTEGLFTGDPRVDANASLIEEIAEIDSHLEAVAGADGSSIGTGGMASKLAAAKIATWSGIRTVVAHSGREDVLADAVSNKKVGSTFQPKDAKLSARKLWISFATHPKGRIVVDSGARQAVEASGRSLLPVGVSEAVSNFERGDVVELVDSSGGAPFARGLSRWSSQEVNEFNGKATVELPPHLPAVLVHRDDLLLLPTNKAS